MTAVFTPPDLELLVMFANQAAMAIDNARLFQETDHALRRRIEELTLFQRIDRELNQSLDLDHVLNLALDWALRLTDSDGGGVGLLEQGEEGMFIRLRVHRSQVAQSAVNRIIPLSHPIVAELMANRKTIQTHAVKAEQALDGSPASVQLALPIHQDGEFLGVIALESHMVTTFLPEDVDFVSRLADRAAVAIKNSRLYDQIRQANEARSKFVSLVTHELRLPLTSINGYTDLLMKGMVGQLTDMQKEMLTVVKRNAGRMSVLISDLSDLNRLESGRMKLDAEEVVVAKVVQEVVAEWQAVFHDNKQTLVVEDSTAAEGAEPLVAHADRARVVQVLTNLLTNAHKYTPQQGRVVVKLGRTPTHALIEVVDTGIGIKPEDQKRLFEQFFRSEEAAVREQTGWGLGLAVVRLFVQEMGGDVTCHSVHGEGSTFAITLPLAPPAPTA
jgi:signal transduction histidine kinase